MVEKFLEGPYEIFDPPENTWITIVPEAYDIGYIIIHPKIPRLPPEKQVECIRIFTQKYYKVINLFEMGLLPKERLTPESIEKIAVPQYWDFTARRLVEIWKSIVTQYDLKKIFVRIRKHGQAPRVYYEIDIRDRSELEKAIFI